MRWFFSPKVITPVDMPRLGARLISSHGEFGVVREIRRGKVVCRRMTRVLHYTVCDDEDGAASEVFRPGKSVHGCVVLRPYSETTWIDGYQTRWRLLPQGTFTLTVLFED